MSDRFYLSRRHAPTQCPECGAKEYQSKRTTDMAGLIKELFRSAYSGWTVTQHKRHPFWRMPYWTASCADCALRAAFSRPSAFSRIKPLEFGTYTISIPLGRDHD